MKKRTLGLAIFVIGALWTPAIAVQDAPSMKRQEPSMKSIPMMKTTAPTMKKKAPVKKKRVVKRSMKRKVVRRAK
ncbi:MAG: hypothetical protein HOP17_08185 [Acidobacteria bacterium]|nr:hypothetical protein [Acidobacteriota bacterium]